MILIKRAVSGLTLALALTVSASCSDHNSALVGRGTLPASQPIPDEFAATMEPVNISSNEIHFRPSSGGPRVVTYSTENKDTQI